ncbi:MAG: phenylalanine--tRNA ligase subunit beta [Xanthomonadales bacterium]|nr:phenylalanine--tRNA ligase subunit beta [Xanthomonadales bacterium]
MKFSENWLRALAPVDADRADLMHRLTMAGLEVEGVEVLGEGLDGVVIGEIIEAEKHPNADKLRVCMVAVGQGEPLQIVCGAPNARVGLKAPLATIGATLPNGIAIKQAKLRDVDSFGMLCSTRELGLSDDHAGLMELPADAPVGQAFATWIGLPDASIEIKLTPNRPDCLSLRGLAAEVTALYGLTPNDVARIEVDPTTVTTRDVRLDAPADCPRYLGRAIEGIDPAAATPLWLKERLRRCGLRSISAVVDATNYVMLELGQPMHTFDLDALHGGIVVRRAVTGEKIKLLDEREVELDAGFLVIADDRNALAVAGVMGGYDSRVTTTSRNLFLESAHFAPAAVQGRARKLGLHTDASHRFERGVDPELPRQAIERLTQLIVEIAGGAPGPVVEAKSDAHLPLRAPVRLRAARLARVTGIALAATEVERILHALGLRVSACEGGWEVVPPSQRFDIEIEEDLIEEVVRVHGYERVPTAVPRGEIALRLPPEAQVPSAAMRAALIARDYRECLHFSFVASSWLQQWGMAEGAVALANPLSADLDVMRTSLLPGLVDALRRNQSRQLERVRLFEIGKSFQAGDPPIETPRLALVATGTAAAEQWGVSAREIDFFDIKGDLEQLFALTGQAAAFTLRPARVPWLHAGRGAELLREGHVVGFAGCLDPRLAGKLGLAGDVYVAELELVALSARLLPRATELSRYPSLRRDIAIVVEKTIEFARLEDIVRETLGPLLREFVLFDEFAGKGLPENTRSLAMGLILQEASRTLADVDADSAVQSVLAALEQKTGAKLRG